jgi:hypothetical protein
MRISQLSRPDDRPLAVGVAQPLNKNNKIQHIIESLTINRRPERGQRAARLRPGSGHPVAKSGHGVAAELPSSGRPAAGNGRDLASPPCRA